ncbi:MAG: (2Fe-2S) ferredoxin domain-containing protein [Planctomycetota bacterium]|jgi:predicted metal-binding protein|nr:(2Fe-2S) ferredoxin domain-containing protein [Planctomycetota bacterium]
MTKPSNLLFVCTNARDSNKRESCQASHDSSSLCKALRDEARERGLRDQLRVTSSGCLGSCVDGPHAVLMPADKWFSGFDIDDVSDIITAASDNLSK